MMLTVGTKFTPDSKKLISFYKPGKRIKTNYSFFKDIFPISKRRLLRRGTKQFNIKKHN